MTLEEKKCGRCGHTAYHHRLDDSKNVSPVDPAAAFRCVWPMPDRLPQQCDCPEFTPDGTEGR